MHVEDDRQSKLFLSRTELHPVGLGRGHGHVRKVSHRNWPVRRTHTCRSSRNFEIYRCQSNSQTGSPRAHRPMAQRTIDVVWYPSLDSHNALLSTIPRIHDSLNFKEFRLLFKKQSMHRYERNALRQCAVSHQRILDTSSKRRARQISTKSSMCFVNSPSTMNSCRCTMGRYSYSSIVSPERDRFLSASDELLCSFIFSFLSFLLHTAGQSVYSVYRASSLFLTVVQFFLLSSWKETNTPSSGYTCSDSCSDDAHRKDGMLARDRERSMGSVRDQHISLPSR